MKTKSFLFLFFVLIVTACAKMPNKQNDTAETNEPFKNSEFVYDSEYGIHYSFSFDAENKIHFCNRSWGLNLASVDVEYEALYGEDVSNMIGSLVFMSITKVKVEHDSIVEFVEVEDYVANYDGGEYLSMIGALFYDAQYDRLIHLDLRYLTEYMSEYVDSMSLIEYLYSNAEYVICNRKER